MLDRRTLFRTALAAALPLTIAARAGAAAPGALAETAETRFIDAAGARIAYRRFGSGKPLMFLQRFRGGMDDWDPGLLNAIAAGGREVVLFDNLGVAESGGVTPATLPEAGEAALAVAAALGIGRPDLFGWSMGGMTAQILGITRPEAVGKLILAGTTPPLGAPDVPLPDEAWLAVAGKPQYAPEDIAYLFFPDSAAGRDAAAASAARLAARRPAVEMKTTPETMGAQYQALSAFVGNGEGWFARLGDIRSPVLVANGDRDLACPVMGSVILAREIPGASLSIHPDAGHGFHFHRPDRTAAEVLAFLAD